MNGILLSAQVEQLRTRRDKTWCITLGTQELSSSNVAELSGLMDKIVAAYISPKEIIPQAELDQVDELDPEFEGKTQSQRIRNILYLLFAQDSEGFKTYDDYYHHKTEKIIEHLKTKIK